MIQLRGTDPTPTSSSALLASLSSEISGGLCDAGLHGFDRLLC